jgi:hypothetical protein
VQVDGEGAVGDVRLKPGDSLSDVLERAVEKKRIESIDWKDVAGWRLWDSPEKVQLLHSGTRSEPLLDLPQFPSKSLLLIKRQLPPTAAASPPPPSVASILASLPLPESSSTTRLSWPLKDKQILPSSVDEMNFPMYLRFVNREEQCNQCVEHFRAQFDGLNDAIIPDFDAVSMLKNRPVVTSAGGPGIGQSHLSPHDHTEAVKTVHVCVVLVLSRPD